MQCEKTSSTLVDFAEPSKYLEEHRKQKKKIVCN